MPSYLVGSPYIGISGNNYLKQITESAAFTSSGNKELIIFPGELVSSNHNIHAFITLCSIITSFDAFKFHVFENIMENGAFAPKESKCSNFHNIFINIKNLH